MRGAKKAYGIRLFGPGRVSKKRSIHAIHQLHSLTCFVQIFYLGMVVAIAKRFLIVPAADALHCFGINSGSTSKCGKCMSKTMQRFFVHVYSFFDPVPSTFESLTGIGIIRIIGTANQIGIRMCEFGFRYCEKIPKQIGYWDCTVASFSFGETNNGCSCRNFFTGFGIDMSICSKSYCTPDGYCLQFDIYIANLNSQYFFAT